MAQESLTPFEQEFGEVALIPGTCGVFEVRVAGEIIGSLETEGRFPETKELKPLPRDRITPEKDIGNLDRKHEKS